MCFLTTLGGCIKTQASVLTAGYMEGQEICIKFTKPPCYYCEHQKNLSFFNFIEVQFFKYLMENVENAILGLQISKFSGGTCPPDPPTNLAPLSLIFKSPHLQIRSGCRPRQWSPGLPSLCQYTHGINYSFKKSINAK